MKRIVALMLLGMLVVGCARKADMPAEDAQQVAEAPNPMASMTPEEMMAKVEEAATPGAQHEMLAPLVGKWKTEGKFWMAPDQEPTVEKGTAKSEWVLGKRFVKEEFKGTWNKKPFQGTGMLGFDNVKDSFVSTWSDSLGTGIMTSEGNFDPMKKEIVMTASFSCPITGGVRESKMITRILSKDKHVLEMFDVAPDGKEMKTMEITYTRKK